ncbi:MAG: hypothetical protein Tsb009_07830 [Planctomycetaceae bacterium]
MLHARIDKDFGRWAANDAQGLSRRTRKSMKYAEGHPQQSYGQAIFSE